MCDQETRFKNEEVQSEMQGTSAYAQAQSQGAAKSQARGILFMLLDPEWTLSICRYGEKSSSQAEEDLKSQGG